MQKGAYKVLKEWTVEIKGEDWENRNEYVVAMIRLSLSNECVASLVANETKVIGLMNARTNMYEKLFASNKIYLGRIYFNICMDENVSVNFHINEVTNLIN